jgi:hypothetical protein
MSQENVELVRRAFEAGSQGDWAYRWPNSGPNVAGALMLNGSGAGRKRPANRVYKRNSSS